jgi:hypothetical protein
MSKVQTVGTLREIVEKLEANAAKQDELAEQATVLVDEETDLLDQLAAARAELNGEPAPPVKARQTPAPPKVKGKPGPKPKAQKAPKAPKVKSAKGNGGGRANRVALHTMIRDDIVAEHMPEGISFADIVRMVKRWKNVGKFKTSAENVTPSVSQAMNKLKHDGEVKQPGGNKTNYVLAGRR